MDEQELKFEEWWQKQLKIGWCKPNHRGIAWDAFRYGQSESNRLEKLVSQAASKALPEPNSQVCEWEMKEYYYETSCKNDNSYFSIVDHFELDNWEYCPYCGKLIHKPL